MPMNKIFDTNVTAINASNNITVLIFPPGNKFINDKDLVEKKSVQLHNPYRNQIIADGTLYQCSCSNWKKEITSRDKSLRSPLENHTFSRKAF